MFNLEDAVFGKVDNKYEKHILTRCKSPINKVIVASEVADTPSPKKEGVLEE